MIDPKCREKNSSWMLSPWVILIIRLTTKTSAAPSTVAVHELRRFHRALIATLISGAKRKNSSKKISHTYRARKYVCNWNGWRWPFHSIEGVLCCDQGLSLLKSLCYVRALIIINHRSRKKNHKYEAPRTSIIPWLMCVDPQRDSWLLILQCRCLMISACNLCLKTYCSIFCRNSSMQSRRNTRIESLSFCHAFVCL